MSKRLNSLIKQRISQQRKILSVFITAGFPRKEATQEIIRALDLAGVDFIELGIPFSDPIADGPVIQEASTVALKNGVDLNFIFEELNHIRQFSQIPVLLMGYFNPIFQFGIQKFLDRCEAAQVDAIIVPDWPLEEAATYFPIMQQKGVDFIPLIAPNTPLHRIREIDRQVHSFIYCVAYTGVTGKNNRPSAEILDFFRTLRANLVHPLLIGFGVRDRQDFAVYGSVSDGVIVGSAFIKKLMASQTMPYWEVISEFVKSIRDGS